MKFTVLGASGYVGSHLAAYLREQGHECLTPVRDDNSIFSQPLGHIVYCIGLTADFRYRPYDTARAHVGVLTGVLEKCKYESLLYLSSTRIYAHSQTASEDTLLQANPQNMSDLYNLTKMTGEALCFATPSEKVRVVRLSNVYGDDWESENFLATVVRDAIDKKHVLMHTSPESAKDYVHIKDVVEMLPKIATQGQCRLYNLAAGENVRNEDLLRKLSFLTGCIVEYTESAPTITFPLVSIQRLRSDFSYKPVRLDEVLQQVVARYQLSQTEGKII